MATVFISYSKFDKIFAEKLEKDLLAHGHNVFRDFNSIMVGENISRKIEESIIKSDFLIPIISKHAIQSNWVKEEITIRIWQDISTNRENILPVLINDCELPIFLRHKKYADFRNQYNNGFKQLQERLINIRNSNESKPLDDFYHIRINDSEDSDEIAKKIMCAILEGRNRIKFKFSYPIGDIVVTPLGKLRDALIRSKELLSSTNRLEITIFVSDIKQEYIKRFFVDRHLPKGFLLHEV